MNKYMVSGNYHKRDKSIAVKRDTLGWSYGRIAEYYNMSKSSIYEAYMRSKGKKRIRIKKKLSTV